MTIGDLVIYDSNASVICASMILFEQRGTLAEGPQSLFKPYVCSGILRGLSIVTMAIYLRHVHPHLLATSPMAICLEFYLKGLHCSLIVLVPRNSDESMPKAELRGNVLPVF